MKNNNGKFQYSPSDLILYMDSPFASWMEHCVIVSPENLPIPDLDDPMMSLLQQKGNEHESTSLAAMKAQGLHIVTIDGTDNLITRTIEAMRSGAEIIYQAALEKSPFYGRADFLIKVPGKSILGDHHYEIWDTKFSRNPKPYYIAQLCCYAEMLENVQGVRPANIAAILANNEKVIWETNKYFNYYLELKSSFLNAHENFNLLQMPNPFESSSYGRWSDYATQLLNEKDHLSQVANITRNQIKKLIKSGVSTMHGLANHVGNIHGVDDTVLSRLKEQAALQIDSVGLEQPLFKIKTPQPNQKQGLSLLPPRSQNDIFFDIEGYPLVDGGLEYLWACVYIDTSGEVKFKDLWAHNSSEEQQTFKAFIEWVFARWQQDQSMHIYHYGNYEIAVCRRLMGRYGTCEHEVDQLLRNEVFIDLYKVVKGGLLLGEPKYSIKNVEHLYRDKRETNIGSGEQSIVAYENWLDNPDGATWKESKKLHGIREYNIDDCISTLELASWLHSKQIECNIAYLGKINIVTPEIKSDMADSIMLRDTLLDLSSKLQHVDSLHSEISETLAWSLEFHRRENKPVFWRFFDRKDMEHHELLNDIDCVAHCIRTEKQPYYTSLKTGYIAYEYKFDPDQEFKGLSKKYYILSDLSIPEHKNEVLLLEEHSNQGDGIIVLLSKFDLPQKVSLIPKDFINPAPIPKSIYQVARSFLEGALNQCAILDFLSRSNPRINGHKAGEPIVSNLNSSDEKISQIIKAVNNLQNSYLVIQGPPGSGKTYTAKHIIADLVKNGKRVGICSNSHKAINNLILVTSKYCKDHNINTSFICSKDTDPELKKLGVTIVENSKISTHVEDSCVIGTTAWGFSRNELANAFDYLFIEEAGQVSTANLIAISRSTKNIVLMGDQMQLGQPSQGSHPSNSGLSTLDYLLHNVSTVPNDMGIFLSTTYRMHSAINAFISETIYDGKLCSDISNDKQIINIPNSYSGKLNIEAGIVYIPVNHEGNTQASDEEVEEIESIVIDLLGRTFTNKYGEKKKIELSDILFITPYNYQVMKLKKALGNQAKVGSVDKFQGQEAPIVILSMCASTAEDSPRGAEFLFDNKRLNVAISRAQCIAIVVANPALTQFRPRADIRM